MTRLRRIEDRDRIFFVTTNLALKVAPLIPDERDIILSTADFLLGETKTPPLKMRATTTNPKKKGTANCAPLGNLL
jgi:hypothetical protein